MCIRDGFNDFLEYDKLSQNSKERPIYRNGYGIEFFHDFNKDKPLQVQLEAVRQKYDRRIKIFYNNINEPTLFVRYISTENGSEELEYISNNYEKIMKLLKKFNEKNDILFIVNKSDDVYSETIPNLYMVEKDTMDNVARRFLDKNTELYNMLCSIPFAERERNLEYHKTKVKKNKYIHTINKLKRGLKTIFLNEYIHEKQY